MNSPGFAIPAPTSSFLTARPAAPSLTSGRFCPRAPTKNATTRMSMEDLVYSTEPFADRKLMTNNVYENMFDAVGNTPLIRLRRASEETGCNVYGKAEFMNPGGSIKARAALYLIKDAEERGLLTPGQFGYIVESSGGNTGISLAEIATARGYKCICVIPDDNSQDKKDMLRYAGATLVEVPRVPFSNPNNYIRLGRRLAAHLGAVYTNQFDNVANRAAHVATTGPEIWAQLDGKVDGFSCAAGTGGTLAGTTEYLRSVSDDIQIGITDPEGAKLVRYFRTGRFESVGESLTEGIGQERITANLEGFKPDHIFEIPDKLALEYSYRLMREEGLYLGTSSAVNVAGSVQLAKALGPGHTVVTVLCDLAVRYQDKIFNIPFLEERGLPAPQWLADGMSIEVEDAMHNALIADSTALLEQKEKEAQLVALQSS